MPFVLLLMYYFCLLIEFWVLRVVAYSSKRVFLPLFFLVDHPLQVILFQTHARQLCQDLPCTNVVSWNVLIWGYSQLWSTDTPIPCHVQCPTRVRVSVRYRHDTRTTFYILDITGVYVSVSVSCSVSVLVSVLHRFTKWAFQLFGAYFHDWEFSRNAMIGAYGQNGFDGWLLWVA